MNSTLKYFLIMSFFLKINICLKILKENREFKMKNRKFYQRNSNKNLKKMGRCQKKRELSN